MRERQPRRKTELGASWVQADGYDFDSSFQQALKESGIGLLLVDDMALYEHYHADIVLNQNLRGNETSYAHRETFTRLLLGTQYALIRKELMSWKKHKRSFLYQSKQGSTSLPRLHIRLSRRLRFHLRLS